ncbi:uncharacterized protein LOC134537065 [Bacillus rossius redtenbacheri]|uniref:uncharacterized protein LOC134537065 n=1 Tax=Bacillus rossius redtenbacheri TaxID=93214 RepID=UPI002FDCFC40
MASASDFFNSLFWLLILVFLSWWVASFCFVPYVIVSIFTPCVSGLKPLEEILLAGVTFPAKCSDNFVNRRSYNSI